MHFALKVALNGELDHDFVAWKWRRPKLAVIGVVGFGEWTNDMLHVRGVNVKRGAAWQVIIGETKIHGDGVVATNTKAPHTAKRAGLIDYIFPGAAVGWRNVHDVWNGVSRRFNARGTNEIFIGNVGHIQLGHINLLNFFNGWHFKCRGGWLGWNGFFKHLRKRAVANHGNADGKHHATKFFGKVGERVAVLRHA